MSNNSDHSIEHHIQTYIRVFIALGVLTVITVAVSYLEVSFIEAFFLVTPIGGSYRSSVIGLFSFLFVMTIGFLYVNIKAVTKPNRVWEESKLQFLSDAKIHHAQVKLGWTSVRFNHWIDSHECKGLKVFNVHLTSSLAQKAFSAFASVITVGIYFLAREELRGLL